MDPQAASTSAKVREQAVRQVRERTVVKSGMKSGSALPFVAGSANYMNRVLPGPGHEGPAQEPDEDAVDPSAVESECRSHRVTASEHGERLDRVLVDMAPEFSRRHLQGLIERGLVQVDARVQTTSSRRVKAGQALEVSLQPTAESMAFRPEAIALAVVHEDDHLIVIDKPVGLVVHPAAGHWSGTLLNGLLAHHPPAAGLPRAGIVHRLDKDTSGLMVVGKTLEAVTALSRDIAAREVHRSYVAIAHGTVREEHFSIDAPLARDPKSRVKMAVVPAGKQARTDVERLAARDACTALRCTLHTGRTHQIRVHLASRGHPLVGDELYGGRQALGMARQALHARELAFEHPLSRRALSFEAPLPPDLAAAWREVTGGD